MGIGWLVDRRYARTRSRMPSANKRRDRGITVIAGSEEPTEQKWAALVEPVVALFVKNSWALNYCGMNTGLGGAVARGVRQADRKVRAVVMKDKQPPKMLDGLEVVTVSNYYARQRKLFEMPQGILVLPGGMGTVAELTGLVALKAANLVRIPVVVLDPDDSFGDLWAWYSRSKDQGASQADAAALLTIAKDVSTAEKTLSEAINTWHC